VWAFDKLKPGAFKADLWRCCVLYVHGGIYLDIKFECVGGFKLVELTDQEYFVRDIGPIPGVFQALLSCFPKNPILMQCVEKIVSNVFLDTYGNDLNITGPHLMGSFFHIQQIQKWRLFLEPGVGIKCGPRLVLKEYSLYRKEYGKPSYGLQFLICDVYNHPVLPPKKTKNLTRQITHNGQTFYSSSLSLALVDKRYALLTKFVNYINDPNKGKPSLTNGHETQISFCFLSNKLKFCSAESVLAPSGYQDVRFHSFGGVHYIYGNVLESYTPYMSFVAFDPFAEKVSLDRNAVNPLTFNWKKPEKHWTWVTVGEEMMVVYGWRPLQLGKVDFVTSELAVVKIDYSTPVFFDDAVGESNSCNIGDEIWFVLSKTLRVGDKTNCVHFFAVFDAEMKLLRFSETFKLGPCRVECCRSLNFLPPNEIMLGYSLLENQSHLGIYDLDELNLTLRWVAS
jgi:hypothetical protein